MDVATEIQQLLNASIGCRNSGDVYYEQKKYKQSLEEYARALEKFQEYLNLFGAFEESERRMCGHRTDFDVETIGNVKIKINVLFPMAVIFISIENCYIQLRDYAKGTFCLKILRQIIQGLDRVKNSLHPEILKAYIEYTEMLDSYDRCLNSMKILTLTDKSDSDNQSNEIDDSDETFKKICLELDKCCSYRICPLPARGIDKKAPYDGSNSCFIATAAYSTSTHPDLDTFRSFRDEKLLTNSVGKQVVNIYYKIGPTIAQYVDKQPEIKTFLKQQLGYLAKWMRSRGVTSR